MALLMAGMVGQSFTMCQGSRAAHHSYTMISLVLPNLKSPEQSKLLRGGLL